MLVVAAPRAHADSRSKRPVTPWSEGVPEASQNRALQMFQQGNVLLEQMKYTEAVARYEQALAVWDHPNIRFNMALCLMNMRQPLQAWDQLKRALRFGDAPLGKRLYTEAMTYQAALEASLAELTVKSAQPDVSILVDGVRVLKGAGEHTMKLLAGKHQLVATRAGYTTDSRALDLPAGRPTVEQIQLQPEVVKVQRENYERRWRWWLPWGVAGTGVALGLVGSGVYLSARSDMKGFDRALAQACPDGCARGDIPKELTAKETAARRKSGVGVGLWAGAGALVIGSGVMAILNRPRKAEERRITPAIAIAPDYVGAGVTVRLE